MGGGNINSEIPLLGSLLCSSHCMATAAAGLTLRLVATQTRGGNLKGMGTTGLFVLRGKHGETCEPWLRDIGQMGSLAGAAYLLNFNAGVLRHAPREQKSRVADKAKSVLDFLTSSTGPDRESEA